MNPPLHDIALHMQRSIKTSTFLSSQRWLSVPATTLLAFSLCASWHTEAQAQTLDIDGRPPAQSNSALPTLAVAPSLDPQAAIPGSSTAVADSISVAPIPVDIGAYTISDSNPIQNSAPLAYGIASAGGYPFEPSEEIEVGTSETLVLADLDTLTETSPSLQQATVLPTAFHTATSFTLAPADTLRPTFLAQAPAEQPSNTSEPANSRGDSRDDSRPDPSAPSEPLDPGSTVSRDSRDLGNPLVQVQGVYTLQGDESSARGRVSASYAITPNLMVGGTLDVTTGDAFSDSPEEGIDLNELYVAVSPTELPNLRFVVGMLDLTSYFDRNSFAKDAATHFLSPVFQSNPALTAAGLGSRPAILLNWSVADPVEIKVAGFSSSRDLDELALDGFAAEVGLRLENLIVRGTYITGRDAGQDDGFREIFQLDRGSNFGLDSDDREAAYGINAEYFIPEINLGLFARYGWYENLDLDRGGSTFSLGFNLLDLFMPDDRLGLAYGRELSNDDLRQDGDDDYPDVWEFFYDFRITPNLRAGVILQSREQFSETIGGFRIRADFDSSDFGRLFR